MIVVAAVMLIAGWYGVSGTPLVAAQLAWLMSGGLGGLLCGIIGVGLLISNDIRRDRERLGRVEAEMLEIREMLAAQADALRDLPGTVSENGSAPKRALIERPQPGRRPAQGRRE